MWEMVDFDLQYKTDCEPADAEALKLSNYIVRAKDPELKEALKDLDDWLFGRIDPGNNVKLKPGSIFIITFGKMNIR